MKAALAASGVCHSDLHAIDRGTAPPPQPIVLGHEAAGIVEATGPHVTELQPGDHVIACLSFFCGKCDYCLVGRTNLCSDKPMRGPAAPPRLSQDGRLYYQGKLMLDEMITKRFRLDQVDDAFQAMREGEVIRSVLMFD